LLTRSWNFSLFIGNILIIRIKKNFASATQLSGRVKLFHSEQQLLLEKLEGTLMVVFNLAHRTGLQNRLVCGARIR
jgi:hypothetical protein